MKKSYFYLPILIIGILTAVTAYFAYRTNPGLHPLRSSLLVNLLASGITVILTAILIDRSIRKERESDSRPGLKYVNSILQDELEHFICSVGYAKDALDANAAYGSTLDPSKRDLKAEFKHGLDVASSVDTLTFTGKHKYTAGWMIEPTRRVLETLDEILSNFGYVLNYTDMTKLYKLKKEISSSLVQIQQNMDDDFDIAEGYYSPDEGYVSNRDYSGDHLSSLKAYYVNKVIKQVLKVHKMHFRSPST